MNRPDVTESKPPLGSAPSRSTNSVLVGAGLFMMSLVSAGQALLVVFIVDKGLATDAFFGAYSVYVPLASLGIALRTSLVPLLGRVESAAMFRTRASELISRVALLGTLVGCGALAASWFLSGLLTDGHSHGRGVAWATLALLMPAAGLQIAAGAIAAALNSVRRFSVAIGCYVAAGTVALGVSAAMLTVIGIVGAAVGLALGAALLWGALAAYIKRFGVLIKPRLRWLRDREQWVLTWRLVAGVALSASQQIALVIALTSLSAGAGAVTLYAYAYFVVGLLLNLSVLPVAVVTLPDLIDELSRSGAPAARRYLSFVTPYVAAVLIPALLGVVLFGEPILRLVFASALGTDDAAALHETSSVLGIAMGFASIFALGSAVIASQRRWSIAVLVACLSVAINMSLQARFGGELTTSAFAQAASTALVTLLLLGAIFGRQTPRVVMNVARVSSPAALFASVTPSVNR